ncbi:unnamed protein product [Chondrus crispus]|uniref:ABC transporter domain-containing protein n=1 Tax=Chondrus crispus TaxID=2769 RepID=R7QRW2_CHOCR|nr:unnamed protein product [Chondrus crispus]CDF40100.1 unnamed protein product [Chondrus crispus]|eukprot:XP_005710394.1 unnamed protein product [Chondrus crispus]
MVAFVGASGAGKSTIIRLLLRFYGVDSGSVLIDGENVKNCSQESTQANWSCRPRYDLVQPISAIQYFIRQTRCM